VERAVFGSLFSFPLLPSRVAQSVGVFAEFERAMIVQRVRAGIAKARAQGTRSGKAIGRPKVPAEKIAAARAALAAGNGIRKVARAVRVGNGTAHDIGREMRAEAQPGG
jgi:DNA invertase Pin-like site-specific DNA recombinase